MKKIIIIAGPNGAGKTTFAREFLPREAGCLEFINADLIAAGLSPFRPELVSIAAGRLMLRRIHELADAGSNFAFETTLATRGYRKFIPKWQASGYRVILYFLKLPNPEFALHRVARRVKHGGHHIPDETVRRRFDRGWKNLQHDYLPILDEWTVLDAAHSPPRMLTCGSEPPTDPFTLMEDATPYASDTAAAPTESSGSMSIDRAGVEAALLRATANALELDRAAGLEPVTTGIDPRLLP